MIENKFLYFDTKAQFLEKAGVNYNVPNQLIYNEIFGDSIVVIKETNEIWTHGVMFQGTNDVVKLNKTYHLSNNSYDIYMSLIFNKDNYSGKLNITSFNAKWINEGTLSAERLPMIPLDKLPHGALERLYIVADEAAALSNVEITEGDSIKRIDTNMMYFCIGNTGTFTERFVEYTAGGSTSIDWSNILNKPDFATVATTGSYNDLLDKPDLVNLLPSNLITGSGNMNCLAKFTSNNNIISGPSFRDNSTSNLFLSEHGRWENPNNLINTYIDLRVVGTNESHITHRVVVPLNKKIDVNNATLLMQYVLIGSTIKEDWPQVRTIVLDNTSSVFDLYSYNGKLVNIDVNRIDENHLVITSHSNATNTSSDSNIRILSLNTLI